MNEMIPANWVTTLAAPQTEFCVTSIARTDTTTQSHQPYGEWPLPAPLAEFLLLTRFDSLNHPSLVMSNAIALSMTRSDDQVVVEWSDANHLFGYGRTEHEAIADFRDSLAELYEALAEENPDNLGADMQKVRELLLSKVGRAVGA